MRRCLATVAIVLAAIAARAGSAEEVASLFPGPQEVSGWSILKKTKEYRGDELGAWSGEDARILADYHVERAAETVYAGPGDARLAVSVYHADSAANAYGLFACMRPQREVKRPKIDQDAFVSAGYAGLWKADVFVTVKSASDPPPSNETLRAFLETISKKVKGTGSLPDIFRAIQAPGFLERSARFLHTNAALRRIHFVSDENVLGLSDRTEMITGKFLVDKRLFDAFIIVYPTEEAAMAAASSYAIHLGDDPEVEAAWFRQWGHAIAGTWTGVKVDETTDSEYMLFDTTKELMRQVKIFQLQK